MLTALLIATSILLALAGLSIMHLAARLKKAEQTTVDDLHMIKTMQLHINDMLETDAVNEQLTANNRELQAKFVELKSIYWNRCRELDAQNDELNAQLQTTKHNAYHREQELLSALEDANRTADDNEWLFNDARQCELDAVKELEELQEVHRAYVEGMTTAEAEQAATIAELTAHINTNHQDIDELYNELAKKNNTIADLHDAIRGQQDELNNTRYKLNQKNNRIEDLKASLNRTIDYWNIAASENRDARNELAAVKEKLAETKTLADNLMSDRIEAIAHMKEQNEKIADLELKEFFDSCEDLDEAIEAAAPQEDIIHLDGNKVWTAIGNWTRLIVYKSSPYHAFIQKAIDGPIKRLAAADLSQPQRTTFKALKQAVKFI